MSYFGWVGHTTSTDLTRKHNTSGRFKIQLKEPEPEPEPEVIIIEDEGGDERTVSNQPPDVDSASYLSLASVAATLSLATLITF